MIYHKCQGQIGSTLSALKTAEMFMLMDSCLTHQFCKQC